MKKHSFSNFTNTTNNPLDEDGNEIVDAKRATHLNETKSSRSGRKYLGIHKGMQYCATVKGVDPTTNVIEVGSSSSSSVKGVIPSTKVIEAGSSSLVKGMVPSTNVIAVGSSSSVLKNKVNPSMGGLRSSERKVDNCVEKREEMNGQRVVKTDTKDHNKAVQMEILRTQTSPRPLHETIQKLNDDQKALLYVDSTECEHMSVEHMRPTTLGWSFDALKKRESSELDSDGLGSATFKPLSMHTPMAIDTSEKGLGSTTFDPSLSENPMEIDKDTNPHDFQRDDEMREDTDRVRLENIKLMDDKIGLIMVTKWEAERLLESLLARYPNDDCLANFIYVLQDIYKYDIQYGSVVKVVRQDKGTRACLEDKGPLKKCKQIDESYHEFAENELGDHLQSPYARRVVDMWVEILNYEEKYRNKDSIRRYFFTTVVMEDLKLHTPFAGFNTQYDMFNAGLARSAHSNTKVLDMRIMDLAFFPIYDDGEYYLVVFNFKSPSVVVLDNHFSRGRYIDDTVAAYEQSVEILVLA
ncbi:hypothetical protein L6452_30487 [Arctium lappa]|uniref:Uncharacterized protein n=1 Tax=Arctium lappa TaxID=4217 RepID=A0ACB8ZID8_ARCLA|nr:hypothetical protein L6452_30487 [Arctium lappa]